VIPSAIVVLACLVASCGSTSSSPDSGTGLFLSDIHFNPLMDKTIVDSLAQAPASQWDSIFATSTQTACATYNQDCGIASNVITDSHEGDHLFARS